MGMETTGELSTEPVGISSTWSTSLTGLVMPCLSATRPDEREVSAGLAGGAGTSKVRFAAGRVGVQEARAARSL